MSDLPAIVSPSGEVVTLTTAQHLLRARGIEDLERADTSEVAVFLDELKHVRSVLAEAEQLASGELVKRMDLDGSWTIHAGDLKVTAPSPTAGTEKYDTEKLDNALMHFLIGGKISQTAALAALEMVYPEPYLMQKAAGIKALLKRGGEVREAIEACRVPVEPPARKAKVSRVS